MPLEEIITKIKKYYLSYLTEKEITDLESKNEKVIRHIVNRIWWQTLTSPFDYEEGKPFSFLINSNLLVHPNVDDSRELVALDEGIYWLSLISSDNLLSITAGETGFIIELDWQETKDILLPVDFNNQRRVMKCKPSAIALFTVTHGEGKASAEYDNTSSIAYENNLLFVDLNKRHYCSNYALNPNEQKKLVDEVVEYYIIENEPGVFPNYERRVILSKKFGSYIIERYQALAESGAYNEEAFLKEIMDYLNQQENRNIIKRTL